MSEGNGNRIPQKWSPKYERVLYLTAVGCSAKEISGAVVMSEKQIYRIRHMPEFETRLAEIQSDKAIQSTIERVQRQFAAAVPMVVNKFVDIVANDKSLTRDAINAGNSLLDRAVPKQTRIDASIAGSIDQHITIHVDSMERFEHSPPVESSYEIICSDCNKGYAPDTEHRCGAPTLAAGKCDLCGATHDGGCRVSKLPDGLKPEALRRAGWPNVVESTTDI